MLRRNKSSSSKRQKPAHPLGKKEMIKELFGNLANFHTLSQCPI